MWIKICGMTDERAVQAALDAQVDAIGFVFAPSVRRLEPARARALAAPARGRLRCVAVTQHPEAALVQEILAVFDPDVLQTDAEDFAALPLPTQLERLPVLREAPTPGAALPAGRVLFEGPRSGTGRTADWQAARRLAAERELVLAGGLTADNVADAIRGVAPFGVDVSSGVESRPGIKDPVLIARFVRAARDATRLGRAARDAT